MRRAAVARPVCLGRPQRPPCALDRQECLIREPWPSAPLPGLGGFRPLASAFCCGALYPIWVLGSSSNKVQAIGSAAVGAAAVVFVQLLRSAAGRPALQVLLGAVWLACLMTAALAWKCAGHGLSIVWAIVPMALAGEAWWNRCAWERGMHPPLGGEGALINITQYAVSR